MKTALPINAYMVRFQDQRGTVMGTMQSSPARAREAEAQIKVNPSLAYVDTIIFVPDYYDVIEGEFTVTPELAPENP